MMTFLDNYFHIILSDVPYSSVLLKIIDSVCQTTSVKNYEQYRRSRMKQNIQTEVLEQLVWSVSQTKFCALLKK